MAAPRSNRIGQNCRRGALIAQEVEEDATTAAPFRQLYGEALRRRLGQDAAKQFCELAHLRPFCCRRDGDHDMNALATRQKGKAHKINLGEGTPNLLRRGFDCCETDAFARIEINHEAVWSLSSSRPTSPTVELYSLQPSASEDALGVGDVKIVFDATVLLFEAKTSPARGSRRRTVDERGCAGRSTCSHDSETNSVADLP